MVPGLTSSNYKPASTTWRVGFRVVVGNASSNVWSVKRIWSPYYSYDGQWHHLAMTWDSLTCTMLLYKDGVQVATSTSACGALRSDAASLSLAQGPGLPSANWNGDIDEVSVFGRPLPAAVIQQHYTSR